MTKISWPEIEFPPINLWVLMSAADFHQMVKDYGIHDIGRRDHYILEGEPLQPSEQTMLGGFTVVTK